MSETEQHFDRHVLLKHAMVSAYGHVDIKSMEAELQSRVDKGKLPIPEDGRWLKPMKVHKLEAQLLSELSKGHLKARVSASREFRAEHHRFEGFTAGQEKAAELILTDLHRISRNT